VLPKSGSLTSKQEGDDREQARGRRSGGNNHDGFASLSQRHGDRAKKSLFTWIKDQ